VGLLLGCGFSCGARRNCGAWRLPDGYGLQGGRPLPLAFWRLPSPARSLAWSSQGSPAKFPGRMSTLINVLTPVPGTYHDNFQLGDPLPELGDWVSIVQRVFEKKKMK